MQTRIQKSRQLFRRKENAPAAEAGKNGTASVPQAKTLDLDLAPDDPLMVYLMDTAGVVEVDRLELDSPALRTLKQAGVKVAVPLISLLNLGPRMSEQDYSSDDRRLLTTLATQAAPVLRVAQMAQLRQVEARERERIDQELRGRIETGVSESAMNAMEYGNRYRADIPMGIQVLRSGDMLLVRVIDQGGEFDMSRVPEPNIEAKLAGQQSPRGWGIFLIKNMVDDLKVSVQGQEHTLELFFTLKEG